MSAGRYDAIVIGGGANGLAAASALAKKYRRVLLLERAETVGGIARTVEIAPGFRAPLSADAGWMPPSVARGLGVRVRMTAPKASIAVRSEDKFLSLPVEPDAACATIRLHSTADAARWPSLVARVLSLSSFLGALYESPAPDVATTSLSDLASLVGLGRRFRALGRNDMTELLRVLPMSIQDFLDDELETPWLKAAVGAGAVRDLRQGPRSGGTTFNLLHYLVGAPVGSVRARDWPIDSPDAITAALEQLAKKRRVEIRTSSTAVRINVRDDAVSGVVLANGDELETSLVVSSADPRSTFALIDSAWLDPELTLAVRNIKFRGCAAFVLYALDALPESALSNDDLASVVSLSPTLDHIERAYDAVKYGRPSTNPHVELTAPSLRWPGLAPTDKHVLVARAQYVPYTDEDGDAFADTVTRTINEALPGFSGRVLNQRVLMPSDLATEFGLSDGAMTHGELTLDQVLFMRPVPGCSRHTLPIDGLYLGGAGATPGPGLPGAAGWYAARAALD